MQMAIADKADTSNRVTVAFAPEPGAGEYKQATVNYTGDLSQFKGKDMVLIIDAPYAPFTIDFTGKNHLTLLHYYTQVDDTKTIQDGLTYLDDALYTEAVEREAADEVIREQLSEVDERTTMITSSGDGTSYLADDGSYKKISGGGAVDSVNGQTGVVVVHAKDIPSNVTEKTQLDLY
jgi:hypothetical protein